MQESIEEMSRQVVDHSLPETISRELQNLLFCGCHRVERIRVLASIYLNRLITSFPSLMCDPPLVFAILEMLNLLQQAAAGEYKDEVLLNAFTEFRPDIISSSTQYMNSDPRDWV
jgi:phosphatidylinositol 4-kinase A